MLLLKSWRTPCLHQLLCLLFDVQPSISSLIKPFIIPSLSSNVFDELLWSIDEFKIYVQCVKNVENHESIFKWFFVKPLPNFVQLHLETYVNFFGHQFKPFHLFTNWWIWFFSNVFASNWYIIHPTYEVISHIPYLLVHSNFDVIIPSTSNSFIHPSF